MNSNIHSFLKINREERGHDVNVTGVWGQGITGKGIVVAILDDGLELDHKDLKANYVCVTLFFFPR